MLILDRSKRTKNTPTLESTWKTGRMCEIKQYLNYILTIINQNILATLKTFLNLQKKSFEKLHSKQTSTAATIKFLSKIPNINNISIIIYLCETEISSDEIIKSINSEWNNKSPGNNDFTAEF